jgi:hypothetical protein
VYDQVLLILPIIFGINLMVEQKRLPYLMIASIFLQIDMLAMILLYVAWSIRMDTWNILISLIVYGFTIWGIHKKSEEIQI